SVALGSVLGLSREQGLSAYDASYLELAAREGLPLATQDSRLRVAAERIGVEILAGPPG
nr:type II toxin-antitoxin system VapC family toxin [Chloroflexota bacterium]